MPPENNGLGWENGQRVPIVLHESYQETMQLSAAPERRIEIRRAAFRALIDPERRPLSVIAREVPCSVQALSACCRRIAVPMGLESLLRKGPAARQRLSEATARTWAKKRADQ